MELYAIAVLTQPTLEPFSAMVRSIQIRAIVWIDTDHLFLIEKYLETAWGLKLRICFVPQEMPVFAWLTLIRMFYHFTWKFYIWLAGFMLLSSLHLFLDITPYVFLVWIALQEAEPGRYFSFANGKKAIEFFSSRYTPVSYCFSPRSPPLELRACP